MTTPTAPAATQPATATPPPAWQPLPRRVGLTLKWVAIAAAVLGPLAIVWPQAARPLVTVLAGVVLTAVALEAYIAIVSRVPHPPTRSAFDHRPTRTAQELPGELTSVVNGMKGFDPRRPVPAPAYWALRRIATDRIALRHGRRVSDNDTAWLHRLVSPELFTVLTADSSSKHVVRGDAFATLLTEIEAL